VGAVNFSLRTMQPATKSTCYATTTMTKMDTLVAGIILYLMTSAALGLLTYIVGIGAYLNGIALGIGLAIPVVYLLYVVKEGVLVLIASLLFLFMAGCLLILPLLHNDPDSAVVLALVLGGLLQIYWMAVILFSPLRQLTWRLSFVALGVLTLVALSEISKLNL